ncbi:hypothetical protein DEDE109153_12620 [Deinococcus deserti]|uniref:Uncharacterized protein n=1 Tax=Deinococcus deserti (strain DSM 17065 / CIP 109153 / LMG 22923 / VCD115) TaxID=546414 RepID=C1CXP2_DEIDV|nr:hypothetical protein [Deinococcus deserti]ACO44848.1 hypothetical protein Deide_00500 [Deinococcus deserti VCD115]
MTSGGLSRLPIKMLGDLVSPRALERIMQDAAQSRGKSMNDLDVAALEDILKREVFKRLQLSVPAPLAKKRVSEVLNELMKSTQERLLPSMTESLLPELEEASRRFSLYFDWPEMQRLRGLIGVAREEEKGGRDISALVQEGNALLAGMARRLEEGLVAQAQDLAELRATFKRVEGMGSRDVRRLETLLTQIDEAQTQGTLLPAEVERARSVTFKLRKLLESSVVQPVGEGAAPVTVDPEAQARVLALEQEHSAQLFNRVEREFAPLLRARPELEARRDTLRAQQQAGQLTAEVVEAWRDELTQARAGLLDAQRSEFQALEAELESLRAGADVRVVLDAARNSLLGGTLINDELMELRSARQALAKGGAAAGELLGLQRELLELERSARDVAGASEELAPLITAAQLRVAAGETMDLTPLWTVLERYMGAAAQQREDFDARADRVVREYDTVRGLAGETTQRLGRMADSLRAQRRLGPMSAEARERYAQALEEAEALLTEAHAEYRAAQEVTSTFGQDALSGLLGVFDMGGGDNDLFGGVEDSPVVATVPEAAQDAALESWVIESGRIVDGSDDVAAQGVVALLAQAGTLGMTSLDFRDASHDWAARAAGSGGWRLARAVKRETLEQVAMRWLETGQP